MVCYVDENKLSHEHKNLVTDIMEEIKKHFGDLVISRDYTNYFLSINIKIRNNNNVDLIIKRQIEDTVMEMQGYFWF